MKPEYVKDKTLLKEEYNRLKILYPFLKENQIKEKAKLSFQKCIQKTNRIVSERLIMHNSKIFTPQTKFQMKKSVYKIFKCKGMELHASSIDVYDIKKIEQDDKVLCFKDFKRLNGKLLLGYKSCPTLSNVKTNENKILKSLSNNVSKVNVGCTSVQIPKSVTECHNQFQKRSGKEITKIKDVNRTDDLAIKSSSRKQEIDSHEISQWLTNKERVSSSLYDNKITYSKFKRQDDPFSGMLKETKDVYPRKYFGNSECNKYFNSEINDKLLSNDRSKNPSFNVKGDCHMTNNFLKLYSNTTACGSRTNFNININSNCNDNYGKNSSPILTKQKMLLNRISDGGKNDIIVTPTTERKTISSLAAVNRFFESKPYTYEAKSNLMQSTLNENENPFLKLIKCKVQDLFLRTLNQTNNLHPTPTPVPENPPNESRPNESRPLHSEMESTGENNYNTPPNSSQITKSLCQHQQRSCIMRSSSPFRKRYSKFQRDKECETKGLNDAILKATLFSEEHSTSPLNLANRTNYNSETGNNEIDSRIKFPNNVEDDLCSMFDDPLEVHIGEKKCKRTITSATSTTGAFDDTNTFW